MNTQYFGCIGSSHERKYLGKPGDFLALNLEVFLGLFQAAGDDDDDLDLFGDETEEDKKAAEEREKAKKASSKKKESELPQSSLCFSAKLCLCSRMSSFYTLLC